MKVLARREILSHTLRTYFMDWLGPANVTLSLSALLPSRLNTSDFETRRRARLIVIAVAVAMLASLMISGMLVYLGHPDTAVAVLWTVPLDLCVYGALLATGSTRVAGHLFMVLIFGEMIWDFGREDGYSVMAVFLLPLAASALIGVRGAISWTVIGILWAGWLGPFVFRSDYYLVPLSLATAAITLIVGIASAAIEYHRAGAVRQAESAEEQLRLGRDAMREFIDTTFPAHIQTDPSGIVRASAEAAELLGLSRESLVGLRLKDLLHPEDAPTALRAFETSAPHGFRTEVRLRHADGSWVWVEGFGVPLRTAGQAADELPWVFAARSIDEERRHRENWQRSQRLEGVGLLAAGVAHDFNNLLTVIRGFTEMMPESEERQHVLNAADKASELTDSLMRFGRVAPKEKSSVDVSAAIRKWSPMFISLLGEDCTLKLDLPDSPVRASIGESQLNQVLLNLVTNAREAMSSGGVLRLAVDEDTFDDQMATARSLNAGQYVRILVRDDGVGMSRTVREHAFDPFFTTKHVGQGTGLGLASVYGIVQQQGGNMELDSVVDRGTAVTVWLPVAKAAAHEPAFDQLPEDAEADAPRKVLLVEDNNDIRNWATRALHERGYTVTSSDNGDDALMALDRGCPDILITDIVMAGMRGTELARAARERYPELSILFMSGYADKVVDDWQSATSSNARFLAKPFGANELVREAEALLAEAQSAA